jgi:RAB protein geranylgeranyltransferase component A
MSYSKFLEEKFKISDKLLDAIVYAIALVDKDGR